jgi:crotonobetainyl-CoA:carnitine CoA-transferase CaiB-like acyl-CoA transferase
MREFLTDIRVLDLSRLLPGQYATTLLADMGAEVIMIEHPEYGNPSRHREPTVDGRGAAQLLRDRGKRSVAVDLKSERGREAFRSIAASADVVLDGFRPGVADRLGVGFDDVRQVNETVVYCSLTGYGQDGPYADRPGHDVNYIGVGGLLSLTGEPGGEPSIPGYPVADFAGALYACTAITAALAGRPDDGVHLDVSMTDVVASFSMVYADRLLGDASPPDRGETILTGRHPGYRAYRTADGSYLTLGALEERFWENLCEATGLEELLDANVAFSEDADDAERLAAIEQLSETIRERPREEWLARFDECDVPAGPLHDFEDVFTDPHLQERGVFEASDSGGAWSIGQLAFVHRFGAGGDGSRRPAPILGEDTTAVLSSVGYDEETIATLAADGIVAVD